VEVEVATSVWVLVDAGAGAGEEANVAQLGAASTRTTLVNGTTTVPIIVDSTIV
jgi:O-antigen ligase